MNSFNSIHLVFFGNKSSYKSSLERLRQQAARFGFNLNHIHVYTENDLPQEFIRTFNCDNTRGYGYWMWKPYIILDVMSKVPKNDIILYMDCGSSLNKKGIKRFFEYIDHMQQYQILCFRTRFFPESNQRFLEKQYNKYDLIKYLDADCFTETIQIMAGQIFLRNTDFVKAFLVKWLHIGSIHHCHFCNDNPSILQNNASFKEHRHDQSIFSLLCKKTQGILVLEDEMIYIQRLPNRYAYPIWVTRLRE